MVLLGVVHETETTLNFCQCLHFHTPCKNTCAGLGQRFCSSESLLQQELKAGPLRKYAKLGQVKSNTCMNLPISLIIYISRRFSTYFYVFSMSKRILLN